MVEIGAKWETDALPFRVAAVRTSLSAALGLWGLGFLQLVPAPAAAQDAPVMRAAQEVFRPDEPILVFIERAPTNVWDWLTIAPAGSHRMERGDRLYLRYHAPSAERRDRWYMLPPQAEGEYELRLFLNNNFSLVASLPVRVAASDELGPPTVLTPVFADRLIEFVAGNQSRYEEPFGHVEGPYRPGPIDPAIVLGDPGPGPFNSGNPKLAFLTLPQGSHVTVGFSKHVLIDGPGPDFFVRGVDPEESAGEVAEVYVSTDGATFQLVDQVLAAGRQPLDLAGLGLQAPVVAIRIVGTDLKGSYPGFELVSVDAVNPPPPLGAALAR